jgi:hypothetical protein
MQEAIAKKNGLNVAALVLGPLVILIPYGGGLLGIFAFIFAMKLRKAGEGDSVSTAGLVTGIVGTACWGVVLVVLLVAAAIP